MRRGDEAKLRTRLDRAYLVRDCAAEEAVVSATEVEQRQTTCAERIGGVHCEGGVGSSRQDLRSHATYRRAELLDEKPLGHRDQRAAV
jgi:hypothetical protein